MSKRRPGHPGKADPASELERLRKDIYLLNRVLRRELADFGRGGSRVALTYMESKVSFFLDNSTAIVESHLMKVAGNPLRTFVVDTLRRNAQQLIEAANRIETA